MIDIHSHVLPGIDDGSRSFEESIEILKNAYEINKNDANIILRYALILLKSGDTYRADEKLQEALALENDNTDIRLRDTIIFLCDKILSDCGENKLVQQIKNKHTSKEAD